MKTKTILKIILSISLCFLLFIITSYFYLEKNLQRQLQGADTKQSNIPYLATPENSGVLFCLPDSSGVLVFLDFTEKEITTLLVGDCSNDDGIYYGYPVDYKIECDYELLAGIVDNAGGIVLEYHNTQLRYTGVQTIDLLSYSANFKETFKDIIEGVFVSISKNGFSDKDMVFIIDEAYSSTLTLPECLNWDDYIQNMAKRVNIIG